MKQRKSSQTGSVILLSQSFNYICEAAQRKTRKRFTYAKCENHKDTLTTFLAKHPHLEGNRTKY
ncbi:hypothetical protein ACT7CZ_02375, partial [Bacillus cereus]